MTKYLSFLVNNIILEELDSNKCKAENYLDMVIDIHKRFVNSEHVEFKKMRKLKKGMGIRYKNNFDLWFQEEIPLENTEHSAGSNFTFA